MPEPNRPVVYRLVVRRPDRGVVAHAAVFRQYKQAVSHVAHAVRQHAADDPPAAVLLQRGAYLGAEAPDPDWTDVEEWGPDVVQRILKQDRLRPYGPGHHAPSIHTPASRRPDPAPQARPRPHPVRRSTGNRTDGSSHRAPAPAATSTALPRAKSSPGAESFGRSPAAPRRAHIAGRAAVPDELAEFERISRRWYRTRISYVCITGAIVLVTWIGLLLMMSGGRPDVALRQALEASQAAPVRQEIDFYNPGVSRPAPAARGGDNLHTPRGSVWRAAIRSD